MLGCMRRMRGRKHRGRDLHVQARRGRSRDSRRRRRRVRASDIQKAPTDLGATIVAAHAGHDREFSVAMKAGAGAKTIAGTIHPYPTQAEVNKKS